MLTTKKQKQYNYLNKKKLNKRLNCLVNCYLIEFDFRGYSSCSINEQNLWNDKKVEHCRELSKLL